MLPIDPTQIQPGSHTVKVVKEGFYGVEKAVTIEPGKPFRLKVDLTALTMVPSETKDFTNSLGMKFVKIPSGSFVMGSGISSWEVVIQYGGDEELYKLEHPKHSVTISRPFYMQTTEVTVSQWRLFIQDSGYQTDAETSGGTYVWADNKFDKEEGKHWDKPGFSQIDEQPVTCVSWDDAQEFIKWLSLAEGRDYRLPREAE